MGRELSPHVQDGGSVTLSLLSPRTNPNSWSLFWLLPGTACWPRTPSELTTWQWGASRTADLHKTSVVGVFVQH